jgi:valyl-tRNA synthetase
VRPETKFGDKYVVMHPEDKRYKKYKHNQKITVEWINGPIEATVIKDTAVDMEFGSGIMTITPWHSQIDFEIAKRHNLDIEQIIDWRGKLLPIAGEFEGLNIKDARPKIIEKLASKGLLIRTDNEYKNTVKRCYKCNTIIEPQVKDQWFVKMEPLAKMALDAILKKEIRFIPDNFEKIFSYWMKNSIDWNISRQIVWGITIPAWFKDDKFHVGIEKPDGDDWVHDNDTFDTWFSSGQWPLITTGYSEGAKKTDYYPTDVMETGHDLIFKWVPRMVIFGLYLSKKVPFHTVYLHGLVNDSNGVKMSKSKGNVINPLDLTSKYGTDALRMALIVGNAPGTDLALREDKVKGYKHFANKIWNASRYVLEKTENLTFDESIKYTDSDSEILQKFKELIGDVTLDLESYRVHLAAEKLYHYFWHTFADVIIEQSKERLGGKDEEDTNSAKHTLFFILKELLKALHPFMPFITEEIWSMIPNKKKLLLVESWPVYKK